MAVTISNPLNGDLINPITSLGWYPPIGNTLQGQAEAIIKKYSASVYLPSTQNFSDSAGTTPAVNDGSVGYVAGQAVGANLFPSSYSGTLSAFNSFGTITVAAGAIAYQVDYTVATVTSGGIRIADGINSGTTRTTTGTYSEIFIKATAATSIGMYASGSGFSGSLTNISVRELGYIATQSTAGYKPTLKSAGRPYYWLFDGTDDRLSLSGPLFQMSDDHFVVACARTANGSTYQAIVAPATDSGGGAKRVGFIGVENTGKCYAKWQDDAATNASIIHGVAILNTTYVCSAVKQANAKRLRVNGAQSGATNNTVVGATTINVGLIAGLPAGETLNGNIYCVIAGKGTITDAELLCLERWAASLGGLSI